MALPVNITELIEKHTVESARMEYKKDWNPESVVHTVCAFANDIDNWGGGYIIIGIDEENGMPKMPIKGLKIESIDRINKDLLQKCNLIEPRYIPIVEHTSYKGAEILVLWVPGGNSRPYKCPIEISQNASKRSDKAYYVRKMSNTIRANPSEEKELFVLSETIPFDDRVNSSAEIGDLKSALISNYLHEIKSNLYDPSSNMSLAELAKSMHIVGGPPEHMRPLNVGLMFFNDRPDDYFRYARIEVVDKPEPTGKDMTEKIFTGPLDRQLRDALSYISNYVIKEKITKIDGKAEAVRSFNYPFTAVEEALSNAVYHKSYQIGEPITVTVTPEKMEITSIPGPDRSIRDEDLENRKMISRRYKNRRIGDFLKELKLAEGRNTGVPTIVDSMQSNGSGLPVFETDSERTYFTVVLYVNPDFANASVPHKINAGGRRTKEENKNLIVEILRESSPISVKELSNRMGYSSVPSILRTVIDELTEDGTVRYLYPEKRQTPKQKIELTAKSRI